MSTAALVFHERVANVRPRDLMSLTIGRTELLLALTVSLVPLALLALVGAGCTPPPPDRAPERGGASVLSSMGFGLVDDGDAATSSGALTATFSAPVVGADGTLADLGTAHVNFTDSAGENVVRDIASATIVDAYPEGDIVYAVLFEQDAPWRYVVIAAHGAALQDGAVLALDGENAAALVVDEETGSGYLSSSGSLAIASASLIAGGVLTASIDVDLVEVGLDAWPESLFPFSNDGQPSEQAPASGAGSFDAPLDGSAGTANVTVAVDGFAPFVGTVATLQPADQATSIIVVTDGLGRRAFAIFIENAALVAGTTVSLGGYTAGAALFEEDGTQLAFVDGTLTLDAVDGHIAGSVNVVGDAWVIPAENGGGFEGEGESEDCTGIEALASTFAPAQVYVEEGIPADEMPAGYDKALTFTDGGNGMLGVLVESSVDLHVGGATAFTVVDYGGRPFPSAVLGLATCSQFLEIDSGSLDADIDDATGRMTGSLSYEVNGVSRTIALDVAVVP